MSAIAMPTVQNGSQTITVAVPPAPQVVVVQMQARTLPDYRACLQDLTEIAWTYQRCRDPMSRSIHRWILTVIPQQELPLNFTPSDADCANLQQRIRELVTQILVEPVWGAPLKDPRLVDGVTVAGEVYEDYVKTIRWCSAQNNPPIHIPPEPAAPINHLFVETMLSWIAPLVGEASFDGMKEKSENMRRFLSILPSFSKLVIYKGLISKALTKVTIRSGLREPAEDCARELNQLKVQLVADITAQAEAIQREAQEHNQRTEERINGIQQVFQATIHGLEDRVTGTEADLHTTQQQLHVSQHEVYALLARTQQLEDQNAALTNQVQDLRNQVNNSSGNDCVIL